MSRRGWPALLAPVGWLYGVNARLAAWRHRNGRRVERLPCPVVSIGGLTAGGVGRAPAAAWVAGALRRRGHRVVLLSRGARRGAGEAVVVVSDGRFVRSGVTQAGDDSLVLAAHAPGVAVLAGRDRARAGRRALTGFDADVVVLDDGFQHHRLHRDADLLVVDGAAGFGNRRCRPAGPLREPCAALARADAVCVVDGPLAAADELLLARRAPQALRFRARHAPVSLHTLAGGPRVHADALRGREVGLLCGAAQFPTFARMLAQLGARVVAERRFAGRHAHAPADLAGLANAAPLWVTSENDALHLPAAWAGATDLRVLSVGLAVEEPVRLLDWLEARLRQTPRV